MSQDCCKIIRDACVRNHPLCIKRLFLSGASINEVDQSNNTDLVYAIEHPVCVQELVNCGIDLSHVGGAGWTPLHSMSVTNNVESARILINAMYKKSPILCMKMLTYFSQDSNTPIYVAKLCDSPRVYKLLRGTINYFLALKIIPRIIADDIWDIIISV